MPIYEYRCQACGHELEKLQRMNDDKLIDCPACYEATLKRLVSAASFRLTGSGWYETDFKQGEKRNLADTKDGKHAASRDSTDKAVSTGDKQADKQADKPAVSDKKTVDQKPAQKVASKTSSNKSNTA